MPCPYISPPTCNVAFGVFKSPLKTNGIAIASETIPPQKSENTNFVLKNTNLEHGKINSCIKTKIMYPKRQITFQKT